MENKTNTQTPETLDPMGNQDPAQAPEQKKSSKREKLPVEETVKIRLPITREERAPVTVWVNERSWIIQRGQEVEVPACVAEVLRNKEMMLEYGIAYDDEHKAQEPK